MKEILNLSVLPADVFALAEQHAGDIVPDVLTLRRLDKLNSGTTGGGLLVADAPPQVSMCMDADEDRVYRALRRTITVRHRSGRELVAMIEIASPGNKSTQIALDQFVDKSASAIRHGIHLLIIDLLPPTARDPQGLHGEIWKHVGGDYQPPRDCPLTLVGYEAADLPKAYVEPIAVGRDLPAMPLFLGVGRYVNVPLADTYASAFQGMPQIYRDMLEGKSPPESPAV